MWQPIETAPREDGQPILLALIRDDKVWRVSDARYNRIGFYTMHGGISCHWATHWMPLPPVTDTIPEPPTELHDAVRQLVEEWFYKTDTRSGESLSPLINCISTFVAARELARDERAARIVREAADRTASKAYQSYLQTVIGDILNNRITCAPENAAGSDSTHVEAIREARLEALEQAVQVARHATLPKDYQYGREAVENFNFGKERAVKAIRALKEST